MARVRSDNRFAAELKGVDPLAEKLATRLVLRAGSALGDVQAATGDFREAEPGARFAHSEHGDGRVQVRVPKRDEYEGLHTLEIRSLEDGQRIDAVPFQETVLPGFGEVYTAEIEPQKWRRYFSGEGRPQVVLRGLGASGDWAPFDPTQRVRKGGSVELPLWGFLEDVRQLVDVSTRPGALLVRPEVPMAPDAVRLDPARRERIEAALGRPIGQVERRAELVEWLLSAKDTANAVIQAGIDGLLVGLLGAGAAPTEEAVVSEVDRGLGAITPALERLLGGGALTPGEYPEPLITLAHEVLSAERRPEAVTLEQAEAEEEDVQSALDAAFGAGFSAGRRPSLMLVEALLDRRKGALSLDDFLALRDVHELLDYELEALTMGADVVARPLLSKEADQAVRKAHRRLIQGTGLDEKRTYLLASKLTAAINVPGGHPQVVVVAGEGGKAVDRLLANAVGLTEQKEPIWVRGNQLRFTDPAGVLAGDPEGEAGAAGGLLLPRGGEGPYVAVIEADGVGTNAAKPEARRAAAESFWSFIDELQRSGGFTGYAPEDGEAGRPVELGNGLIFIKTALDSRALKEAMPPAVWNRLSARVVDLGVATLETTVAGLKAAIEEELTRTWKLADARVDLHPRLVGFVQELLAEGVPGELIQEHALDEILPRIAFFGLTDKLVPELTVRLAGGRSAGEWAEVKKAWIEGRANQVGGGVFSVSQTGRFEARSELAESVRLARSEAAAAQEDNLAARTLVAYKLALEAGRAEKNALVGENRRLVAVLEKANVRIDQLTQLVETAKWRIEDLEKQNKIAKETIERLEAQVAKANADIERLKAAGASMEKKVHQAVHERDDAVAVLRETEQQINQAAKLAGRQIVADRGAMGALSLVAREAPRHRGNRFGEEMMRQALYHAAVAALNEANLAQHQNGKFRQVAGLAAEYRHAAQAAGVPVEGQVLDGLMRAAFLSRDGFNVDLNRTWDAIVGGRGQERENDPNFFANFAGEILRRAGIRPRW